MLEHPVLRQQYLRQLPPQDWYQQSLAASAFAAGARRSSARSASRLINFMVFTFLEGFRCRCAAGCSAVDPTGGRGAACTHGPGIGAGTSRVRRLRWPPLGRATRPSIDFLATTRSWSVRARPVRESSVNR